MNSHKSLSIINKGTRISITSFTKSSSRLLINKSTKIMRPRLSYHQLQAISMVTKESYSMRILSKIKKMESMVQRRCQMEYTMFMVRGTTPMEILTISSTRTPTVSWRLLHQITLADKGIKEMNHSLQ